MVWNSLGIRNFNLIVRLSSKYFQCFEEKCKIFLMNIRKNAASEIISSTFEQRFMYIVRKGLHCRLHPLSSLLRRHIFSLFLWNHEFFLWYSTSTSLKYLTSIFKILVIYIKEVYKVFYSLLLNCSNCFSWNRLLCLLYWHKKFSKISAFCTDPGWCAVF